MLAEGGDAPRRPADDPGAARRAARPPRAARARGARARRGRRQGVLARRGRSSCPRTTSARVARRDAALARAQGAASARSARARPRRRRLPVPARADPRCRLRRIPKATRADLHERFARLARRAATARTSSSGITSSRRRAIAPSSERRTTRSRRAPRRCSPPPVSVRSRVTMRAPPRAFFSAPASCSRTTTRRGSSCSAARASRSGGPATSTTRAACSTSRSRSLPSSETLRKNGQAALIWPPAISSPAGSTPTSCSTIAKKAISVFDASDDAGLARAWRRVAHAHMAKGQLRGLERGERASARARARGRRAVRRGANRRPVVHEPSVRPGAGQEAVLRCEAMLVEAHGNQVLGANVAAALVGLLGMRGAFDAARERARFAEEIYLELDLQLAFAGLTQVTGPMEFLAGEAAAAERELQRGLDDPPAARPRRLSGGAACRGALPARTPR